MKIAVGCDHAGYPLKALVVQCLQDLGHDTVDFGCAGPASVDYPDVSLRLAQAVATGECKRGVLICGTGIGSSIAANKIKGIRAAVCCEPYTARFSRLHNDANVLCLGARVLGHGVAEEIVKVWMTTDFSAEERHRRRLDKIAAAESSLCSE